MHRFPLLAPVAALLSCFASTAFSQDAAKSRTWTSDKGHKLTATLVENGTDAVKLKKDTGKTIEVKLSKLSPADQKYLLMLRERAQKETTPEETAEPKETGEVSDKPEVTEDDLFEMGKELDLPSYGGSIRSPFLTNSSVHSSSRSWNEVSVSAFSATNNKNRSESIGGWSFGTEENNRKKIVKSINRFMKERLQDKRGQFSTKTPIPDWLEAEKGTANNSRGKEVNFRLFLYFGERPHLLQATADSPERLEFLVKTIGTFVEKSPETPSSIKDRLRNRGKAFNKNDREPEQAFEENFRTWKDSTGEFQINATLTEATKREVTLKTRSGKEIQMAVDKLSTDDQQFALKAMADQRKKRFGR